MPDAAELTVERVLCAVECIPAGRVASYGDIADLVGTSARRVGAIMASAGSQVPWWRVVNAAGRLPAHLMPEATRHWAGEKTPTNDGQCAMTQARADLSQLAAVYETMRTS